MPWQSLLGKVSHSHLEASPDALGWANSSSHHITPPFF